MPSQMLEYSWWSRPLMSASAPTTTSAVAVTITLAAVRIEGGSRRNFDIRRSMGFRRALRTASTDRRRVSLMSSRSRPSSGHESGARRRFRRELVQLVLAGLDHAVRRLRHLVPRSGQVAQRLGDDQPRLV